MKNRLKLVETGNWLKKKRAMMVDLSLAPGASGKDVVF
jgi:hypothetical protein